MNSRFKFPRRVRIHGGECGAVARALHHEAKIQSLPAVKGNVFFTTNERKSMSTKTTFKRIALIAVAALGFGTLSAAPSNAAFLNTDTAITATAVGRVGLGIDILVKSQLSGSGALDSSSRIHIKILSGPSSTTTGCIDPDKPLTTACSTANYTGLGINLRTDSVTVTTAAGPQTIIKLREDVGFDTYIAGTYRMQVWVDATNIVERSPDNTDVALAPFDVTLGGTPTQFTLTSSSASLDSSTYATQLVEGTIKDAAGVETLLLDSSTAANESFVVVSGGAGYEKAIIADTNTAIATAGLLSTSIDSTVATGVTLVPGTTSAETTKGAVLYLSSKIRFYVGSNSSSTTTFTIKGTRNLLGIDSAAFTLTMANPAKITAVSISSGTRFSGTRVNTALTGVTDSSYGAPDNPYEDGASAGDGASVPLTEALYASTATGKSVSFEITTSAAGTVTGSVAAVATTTPVPTGVSVGSFTFVSDTLTTVRTFTATAPLPGDAYKVTLNWGDGKTSVYTVTYKAPTISGSTGEGSIVTNIDSSPKAAAGSTNTIRVTAYDGFGELVSGATIRMTHDRTATGVTSAVATATTDANGQATFTVTDAFAGTTTRAVNSSGTFSFTASTANASTSLSDSATLNYTSAAFVSPGAITITEDANDDDTVGNIVDTSFAETITVTSETGVAMAGIAYTVTLSDGLYEDAVISTLTGFTDSTGKAKVVVAPYKSGVQTVTFTVGTLTKSDTFTAVSAPAKLRALSVDKATLDVPSGTTGYVTVTAKDVYGNVVPDAALTITYTGTTGRIVSYNGAQGNSATTDKNGLVVVGILADGAGSGTLTVSYPSAVAATVTTTAQGVAPIARVASVSTAVTTSGVSAAVAAAEAATDAASEAIDAANAATDAANLAAEAADAATVAAEEARDAADAATAAVEELATQVATLMAALKAQITTLANTVAKIAKKVKA